MLYGIVQIQTDQPGAQVGGTLSRQSPGPEHLMVTVFVVIKNQVKAIREHQIGRSQAVDFAKKAVQVLPTQVGQATGAGLA